MLHGVDASILLAGDVVPLEDYDESDKPIITSMLVGKVICSKTLNRE